MDQQRKERARFTRDELLIRVASLIAERSTCFRSRVGAVIAQEGRIISTGYNGTPSGLPHCSPNDCGPDTPCTKTVHAEANAIAFAARYGIATEGATLYTQLSPCNDCAKLIINSGIERVVFQDYYRDEMPVDLLARAGIELSWYA